MRTLLPASETRRAPCHGYPTTSCHLWAVPALALYRVFFGEQAVERNFERMGVLFKSFNRRDGIAIFHATGVAPKETCPLLNVTLAQILGDTQLAEFGTDLHAVRLHLLGSARNGYDVNTYPLRLALVGSLISHQGCPKREKVHSVVCVLFAVAFFSGICTT